ncbi:hypothetical protein OsI_30439 [Oryza sativa Indica Group]|uniref:Reverse transcriptase zinc-binding domain-containing protein n=1 Tax=Oryza sativa subsp. indica TaxID=39946 RepID=B8BD10_ORYSI|nr:hypothetical protein OsI_30439 [Oryza sativa Indica Group]
MSVDRIIYIPIPKWAIKRIDKLRRAFLWKGDKPENIKPGASLEFFIIENLSILGGLGIHYLQKFSSAWRLTWLWLRWTDPSKPWEKLDLPYNKADVQLSHACTKITLDVEVLHELVQLGSLLHHDELLVNTEDKIEWTQTTDGLYSARSAYHAQFFGTERNKSFKMIWTAEAQSKQRFLGWLILHQKTLTAENLLIRHWPCNWICQLCTEAFEDTDHLFRQCKVTKQIWQEVSRQKQIPAFSTLENI